jgi:glycosyltransferase involved in cell wall biosynthesis
MNSALAEGSLAVLIPARDEAATIASVVAAVRLHLPQADVLVVDDGSLDDTGSAANAAGARVLRHDTPLGKGAALRTGFQAVGAPLVLTLDGDGQDDAADLPALVDCAAGDVDLVIGSRFLGQFEPGSISWPNYLATRVFNLLIYLRRGARVTDSQAGVRCYRKATIEGLDWNSTEYEVETELLLRIIEAGGSVREIPVRRQPRRGGKSSFQRLRHGVRILRTILQGRAP